MIEILGKSHLAIDTAKRTGFAGRDNLFMLRIIDFVECVDRTNLGTARIGAPPDDFNPLGQNWGLPPMHPIRLRERGYAPFIDILRANMRHAGVLRIDHAIGLQSASV